MTAVRVAVATAPRSQRGAGRRAAAMVLAAIGVLVAALVPLAPAAHAAVADITCVGTETQTFSPGLLLTPQTVTLTVHSIYNPCVSTGDPSITFGTTDFSSTRTFSCLSLLNPSSGTMTFSWSNGRQSTFSFNRSATTAGGQLVVSETGVITDGEFVGDTVERIVTGPTINTLQCLSPPGITSRTGEVNLVITSLKGVSCALIARWDCAAAPRSFSLTYWSEETVARYTDGPGHRPIHCPVSQVWNWPLRGIVKLTLIMINFAEATTRCRQSDWNDAHILRPPKPKRS